MAHNTHRAAPCTKDVKLHRSRKDACTCKGAIDAKTTNDARVQTRREVLDAVTYIDVLGQQLVGYFVLVQDVVVDGGASDGGSEEKAEHSRYVSITVSNSMETLVMDG